MSEAQNSSPKLIVIDTFDTVKKAEFLNRNPVNWKKCCLFGRKIAISLLSVRRLSAREPRPADRWHLEVQPAMITECAPLERLVSIQDLRYKIHTMELLLIALVSPFRPIRSHGEH